MVREECMEVDDGDEFEFATPQKQFQKKTNRWATKLPTTSIARQDSPIHMFPRPAPPQLLQTSPTPQAPLVLHDQPETPMKQNISLPEKFSTPKPPQLSSQESTAAADLNETDGELRKK